MQRFHKLRAEDEGFTLFEIALVMPLTLLIMTIVYASITSASNAGQTNIAQNNLLTTQQFAHSHLNSQNYINAHPDSDVVSLIAGTCDEEEGRERIDVGGLPDGTCVKVTGSREQFLVTLDSPTAYGIYDSKSQQSSTYLK